MARNLTIPAELAIGLYLATFLFSSVIISFYIFIVFNYKTYNPWIAYKEYQQNTKIRKRYLDLFSTRENFLYHIGKSKAKGEYALAKDLMKQLDKVDQVCSCLLNIWFIFHSYFLQELDHLEMTYPQLFPQKKHR